MNSNVKKIGLSFILVSALVFGILFSAGEGGPSSVATFDSLPTHDLFGEEISYQSKYYLVDAWATWCPPCVYSVPEVGRFHRKYADKGISVLGLSVDRGPKEVIRFLEANDVPYPVAMMSSAARKVLPKFRAIPSMFLLDAKGKVVWQHTGAATMAVLESELAKFIDELESQ